MVHVATDLIRQICHLTLQPFHLPPQVFFLFVHPLSVAPLLPEILFKDFHLKTLHVMRMQIYKISAAIGAFQQTVRLKEAIKPQANCVTHGTLTLISYKACLINEVKCLQNQVM